MNALYEKLKDQGLNVIAINGFEPKETILKYVKEGKFAFPMAMNGKDANDVAKAYGVQAYPTNYVLDPTGKIVARFTGYNEEGIKKALKELGLEP